MITLKTIEEKLKAQGNARIAGDHSLNPGMVQKDIHREAAVLILLVERADGLHVVFTKRAAHLSNHAGQISFPGGGAEKEDADRTATALREAAEEIGLDPEGARVLGTLPAYVTRSGFSVTPVVAVLERDQVFRPDPGEVERILEVPLAHILSPGVICEETRLFEGKERRFFAFAWDDDYIWGATAGMLFNFADTLGLYGETPPAPCLKTAPRHKSP